MKIANAAPRFLVEHVQGIMLHIVIAGKKLVSTLAGQHHGNVLGRQLAGEVAGDGAAHQGGIIAFQLIDDNRK